MGPQGSPGAGVRWGEGSSPLPSTGRDSHGSVLSGHTHTGAAYELGKLR